MKLSDLMVDTKSAWIDFPELKGFEVEVAILARPELTSLHKSCLKEKFDRKTHQKISELDEDKFVDKFTDKVIKGWKGLKLKYLEELLVVDLDGVDPEKELPYDHDNAVNLVKNSSEFDKWINEVVYDLDNFRSKPKGRNVETPAKLAG